jgi:hypothetical protein
MRQGAKLVATRCDADNACVARFNGPVCLQIRSRCLVTRSSCIDTAAWQARVKLAVALLGRWL